MRKRNLMIGAVVALASVVALAGIASATISSHTFTAVAQKKKQHKKVRGPIGGFAVTVATGYSSFGPRATSSVLTFSRDFKFSPGKLAQCNATALTGKDAAGARAACPRSIVGQGSAVLGTLAGTNLNGIVTAFNGVRSGGNPTILLHVDVQGSTNKPILTGTINGNVVSVSVPLVTGVEITNFQTTINQVVTQKKRVKGKVVKTYYVSAKCSKGRWTHSETSTYEDGSTRSATTSQKCKKLA